MEQNIEYLENIKTEEDSIIRRILNKQSEENFATMFEDVKHERSLLLLLSLTAPDILKQSKFTDHEVKIKKNLATEKKRKQKF